MPYGFFITDKGRELLVEAGKTESKVEITKACFGSGGNPEINRNYGITELVSQFYEKNISPDTDSYEISSVDPTQLCIHTVVPNEITGTINEIGYKDDEDNLIFYGIVKERYKEAGSKAEAYQFEYTNWLKLENVDVEKIEIITSSIEYDKFTEAANEVRQELKQVNNNVTNFVNETSSSLEDLELEIDTKVSKENDKRLLTTTEGNQIAANKTNITGLQSEISTLKTNLSTLQSNLDKKVDKETNKRLVTNSEGNQIATNKNNISSLQSNLANKVDKVSGKDLVSTSDYSNLKSRVTSLESTLNDLKTVLEKYL